MTVGYESFLSKLSNKKLTIKVRKKGTVAGKYLIKKSGASTEFNDFRLYQHGDDIRQIDWNVYGRTKKHYIKTFLDEHMYEVGVFLDYSNSMKENVKKWELAKLIASSLVFVTLHGQDQVQFLQPANGRLHLRKAKGSIVAYKSFMEIMKSNEALTNQRFIEQGYTIIPKTAQMIFIISDFLEPIDMLEKWVKKMTSQYQYVYFIQVLAIEEVKPTYIGDVALNDSETNEELQISMNASLVAKYEQRVQTHINRIDSLVKKYGGNFLLCTTDKEPLDIILKDFVKKEIFM